MSVGEIEAPKTPKSKKVLTERVTDAVPGIAWRDIRDAFKAYYSQYQTFTPYNLAARLFRQQMVDARSSYREFDTRLDHLRRAGTNPGWLCGVIPEIRNTVTPILSAIQPIIDALLAENMIKKVVREGDKIQRYSLDYYGMTLRRQTSLKPISRDRADALLAQLVEVIQGINADPESPYRIPRLAVFGSYLSDKSELGDLDIAADFVRNQPPYEEGGYKRWLEVDAAFAQKHGRKDGDSAVCKHLKFSRHISLSSWGQLEHLIGNGMATSKEVPIPQS